MVQFVFVCIIVVSFCILLVISVVQDFDYFLCHDGLEILNNVFCFKLYMHVF